MTMNAESCETASPMDDKSLWVDRRNLHHMDTGHFAAWRRVAEAAAEYAEMAEDDQRGLHETLEKILEALVWGLARTKVHRDAAREYNRVLMDLVQEVQDLRLIVEGDDRERAALQREVLT